LKILLDENMPHQLRGHLPNHDVSTAVYVGFGGFTNGELLQAVLWDSFHPPKEKAYMALVNASIHGIVKKGI
jgi:hypothetical protein